MADEAADVITPLASELGARGAGTGLAITVPAPKGAANYKVHPGGGHVGGGAGGNGNRMRARTSSGGSSASNDTPQAMHRRMSWAFCSNRRPLILVSGWPCCCPIRNEGG